MIASCIILLVSPQISCWSLLGGPHRTWVNFGLRSLRNDTLDSLTLLALGKRTHWTLCRHPLQQAGAWGGLGL